MSTVFKSVVYTDHLLQVFLTKLVLGDKHTDEVQKLPMLDEAELQQAQTMIQNFIRFLSWSTCQKTETRSKKLKFIWVPPGHADGILEYDGGVNLAEILTFAVLHDDVMETVIKAVIPANNASFSR